MMRHDNLQEIATLKRRQKRQAWLATQEGRQAYWDGKDGGTDNPYNGWNELPGNPCLSHQCLLWCRFLLGWLREYDRNHPQIQKAVPL